MLPNEYQRLAHRTETDAKSPFDESVYGPEIAKMLWRLMHAQQGLADEVGEFTKQIKAHLYYSSELNCNNLVEELGDALWYIALACNAMDADLEYVMEKNIEKLRKRFPNKFTAEAAQEENRDREAEAEVFGEENQNG